MARVRSGGIVDRFRRCLRLIGQDDVPTNVFPQIVLTCSANETGPPGIYRGDTRSYEMNDNLGVAKQVPVIITDNWTTANPAVSRQLYTNTTNKTLYIEFLKLSTTTTATLNPVIRDATADAGTAMWRASFNGAGDDFGAIHGLIKPVEVLKGLRIDAADLAISTVYSLTAYGFEEST